MARNLDVVRRKMLRYVLRIFRKRSKQNGTYIYEEDWAEYLKRAARRIVMYHIAYSLESWSCVFKMRKWNFAGRLARSTDRRWSSLLLDWTPSYARRSAGRPHTRWEDDLVSYAGDWRSLAQDEVAWKYHGNGYVTDP